MSGLIMKYFVLKPKGNDEYARASRVAMRAYADWIKKTNPDLAEQLMDWANKEAAEFGESLVEGGE